MFDKRINIFVGHFGSGKTEVSVNSVLLMNERNYKTAIVDLDIVNPFFRTADVKKILVDKGIKVITPVFAGSNTDVPALPAEISSVFDNQEDRIFIDVGGDELGARVLARYREGILENEHDVFMVVNTKRPETDNDSKILDYISLIENSSGIKISGLINNTNLLNETTNAHIMKGQEILNRVSKSSKIPVRFISGFKRDVLSLNVAVERIILNRMIKTPFGNF